MVYDVRLSTYIETGTGGYIHNHFTHKYFVLNDEKEFKKVQELCENRHNMAGLFKSTVIPIRTDRMDILMRDLFFPTLLNFSLDTTFSDSIGKTRTVGTALFLVISALWDITTLPIRLLTLLPRIIYNKFATPSEHPLQLFLREKGISIERKVDARPTRLDPLELQVCVGKWKSEGDNVVSEQRTYRLAFFDRQFSFAPTCSHGYQYLPKKEFPIPGLPPLSHF